ncbi:hypothetical protein BCT54_19555 [Vibrio splendidus]|uniref:Uncharacterized protein n=1 Tax=Vibrio splendidus TaxID=29497 RepID=A0A2N7JTZ5_VIBSP|nr:hypothetical protein BCT54_19555 [Vibrio splendidus]
MMSNRTARRMMVDVANDVFGVRGHKTAQDKGFFGFDDGGVFHCSGSNFCWIYEGFTVSLKGNNRSQ